MSYLDTQSVFCPFCASCIEIVVDCSIRRQEYIEDCEVCCRPLQVSVAVSEDFRISIDVRPENG